MTSWIFVTGGVLSGLGKGLVSASIAKLLESRGHRVIPIKCDGYLNVDPGTMNPHEHGEVFVLQDGGEVDMDFGHYERFLDVQAYQDWNLTSGKIFSTVIDRERQGDYLGNTVQMVPHVTDEIKDRFQGIASEEDADIVIVEIGGTVGDIENMLYLEAVRQMRSEENTAHIHLTLVPYLDQVGEQKTKPTQHSVKELQKAGLQPDIIIGRSEDRLTPETKEKIALFCDVGTEDVISDPDTENIYRLPLIMADEGADERLLEQLEIESSERDIQQWRDLVNTIEEPEGTINIAICGKYDAMDDSYVSIIEALRHAGAHIDRGTAIDIVSTEDIPAMEQKLPQVDAVVIPGGFGSRGIEGKIRCAEYCRENDIPLLGICLGMQMMIVEYARNSCGLEQAHSTEMDEDTPHPIIDILPDQQEIEEKGGTMRLGAYSATLRPETRVSKLYRADNAVERHRHRYEVNPDYHDILTEHGLRISGISEDGRLAEYIELPDHPFYIGTQAHPEFTSRLEAPNPLYRGLLEAAGE